MLIYVTLMPKGTFTVSKSSKGTYLNSKGTETKCEKSIKKKVYLLFGKNLNLLLMFSFFFEILKQQKF